MKKILLRLTVLSLALLLCVPTVFVSFGEGGKTNKAEEQTDQAYTSLYVTDIDGDGESDVSFFYDAFSHQATDSAPTEIVDRFGNRAKLIDTGGKELSAASNITYVEKGFYFHSRNKMLSLTDVYDPSNPELYLELVISQTGERVDDKTSGSMVIGPSGSIQVQMYNKVDENGDRIKKSSPIDESYGVVSSTYWGANTLSSGTKTELFTDRDGTPRRFMGGYKDQIFTAGVAIKKSIKADICSYDMSYVRDCVTIAQSKEPVVYTEDNDTNVKFGVNFLINYHAIRLYSKIPTEAQLCQNHFADLLGYTGLDPAMLNALSEEERTLLYASCAEISLSDVDASQKITNAIQNLCIEQLYVRDADENGSNDASLLWNAFDKKEGDTVSETAFKTDAGAVYGDGYLFNNLKELKLTDYLTNFTYGDQTAQTDFTVELVMSVREPSEGESYASSTWYLGNFRLGCQFRQKSHAAIADGPMMAWIGYSYFAADITSGSLGVDLNKSGKNYFFPKSAGEIFTSTFAFDMTLGSQPDPQTDKMQVLMYQNGERFSVASMAEPFAYDATKTNDKLVIGSGAHVNLYAIRIYSTVLTETQIRQNHFADLLSYHHPAELSYFAQLSPLGRAAVQAKCESLTLGAAGTTDALKTAIMDVYQSEQDEVYLGEYFLDFDGYSMRMVGAHDLRVSYTVDADYISALPSHVSVLEMGVLVAKVGAQLGNADMQKEMLTVNYVDKNQNAEKYAFYDADTDIALSDTQYHVIFNCGDDLSSYAQEYMVRGYVTVNWGGMVVTLYENAESSRFGDTVSLVRLSAAVYGEGETEKTPDLAPECVLSSVIDQAEEHFAPLEQTVLQAQEERLLAEGKVSDAKQRADELKEKMKELSLEGVEANAAERAKLQEAALALLADVSDIKAQSLAVHPLRGALLSSVEAEAKHLESLLSLAASALGRGDDVLVEVQKTIAVIEEETAAQKRGFRSITLAQKQSVTDALAMAEQIGADIAAGNFKEIKTLKVLAIGNSFSNNALSQLYDIAASFGYDDIVLGHLMIGGCSIQTHAENARENKEAYSYSRNTTGTKKSYASSTLIDGLTDEDWQFITVQQVSHQAPVASSLTDGDLDYLLEYINTYKNPEAEIYYHATWAYSENFSYGSSYKDRFTSIEDMDAKIASAVESVILPHPSIDGVIYSGVSVAAARDSLGTSHALYSDNTHLGERGCYVIGLTWFGTLTGEDIGNAAATDACNFTSEELPKVIAAAKEGIAEAK